MKKYCSIRLLFAALSIAVVSACAVRTTGIAVNAKIPSQGPNAAYSFAAYGDTRTGLEAHKIITNKILAAKPDFIVNTGDLVMSGYDETQWKDFEEIINPLVKANIRYYSALGNHERDSDYFYKLFGLERDTGWYSVEYNTSHVIFLDTNKPFGPGSPQYNWLIQDLKNFRNSNAPTPRFLFVAFHHPPYSSGNHGSNYPVRNVLCPLFAEYKADIVFSGHDHAYERSLVNGAHYVVTGGGGAPLYGKNKDNEFSIVFKKAHHYCIVTIEGRTLKFEATGLGGELLDSFEIIK